MRTKQKILTFILKSSLTQNVQTQRQQHGADETAEDLPLLSKQIVPSNTLVS